MSLVHDAIQSVPFTKSVFPPKTEHENTTRELVIPITKVVNGNSVNTKFTKGESEIKKKLKC